MKRMTRMILALVLLTVILPSLPSEPPSSAPWTEPASEARLTLTEAELEELLLQAIDEATAPILTRLEAETQARQAAEGRLSRLRESGPWITAGAVALLAGAFLGGFIVGAQ